MLRVDLLSAQECPHQAPEVLSHLGEVLAHRPNVGIRRARPLLHPRKALIEVGEAGEDATLDASELAQQPLFGRY